MPSILATRFGSLPPLNVLLVLGLTYLFAFLSLRRAAAYDPTSIFFRPDVGFQRRYSIDRELEALSFIASAKHSGPYATATSKQSICVAIPTFGRGSVSYFDSVLGSLLDGLSEAERQDIYVLPLIAHADPHTHAAYHESWLVNLVDEVLTYNSTVPDHQRIAYLERTEKGQRKKSLYDYRYALQSCYRVTSAPYILFLEDDVLAVKGWYAYVQHHLLEFERKNKRNDALYLRLFYTEKNFGWNKEQWRTYLFQSLLFEIFVAMLLIGIRSRPLRGVGAQLVSLPSLVAILLVFVPALVALYFAAGRLTVSPLPRGVHAMNKYGCCTQAMLFPRDRIPGLVHRFGDEIAKPKWYYPPDTLIESYADDEGWKRWALTPVPFQHIGSESGKLIDKTELGRWARPRAANIWNFEFETYWKREW